MQYLTVELKYCIMENSINQRIREFINSLGVNDNQFAKSIGITQSVIASMFSRNTEPSSKVIVSILNAYANLSAEWLMRGEGKMTKGESNLVKNEVEKTEVTFYVDENGFLKLKKWSV